MACLTFFASAFSQKTLVKPTASFSTRNIHNPTIETHLDSILLPGQIRCQACRTHVQSQKYFWSPFLGRGQLC